MVPKMQGRGKTIMKNPCISHVACILTVLLPVCAEAQSQQFERVTLQYEAPPVRPVSLYDKGKIEFSTFAHYYWSFAFGSDRPTLDYALGGARLGYMLFSPRGAGRWRYNDQLLIE